MKKTLVLVLTVILCGCLSACGASGKNVTGITATESMVYFNAKCPYCNHVNPTSSVNISEGEIYETTVICKSDNCCKAFDISIKR